VKSGSLYHVSDVYADDIKGLAQDRQWFTEDIVVQGTTVTVKIGGKELVKWNAPEIWLTDPTKANRRLNMGGTIALQGHDPTSTVHYRNIRIRPL
jgi:hypothetical protein